MDTKEFVKAVDTLEKEKGINREVIFEGMEQALAAAYRKEYNAKTNVKVIINRDTGDIKVYSFIKVVPDEIQDMDIDLDEEIDEESEENEIYDPEIHLLLSDAKLKNKDLEIGDTIDTEVTPGDFGRVSTSTAKQVLIQKIREAERESLFEEFGNQQDELLVGTVQLEDAMNYYINLGRSNGILPKKDIIPGEKIEMGKQIKVYVSKVEISGKGLLILLTRSHYGFVKRLFEIEIPEINDGSVLVYSVAREPGERSKVAVYSEVNNIDPVGASIGEKGSRINKIIKELNGEKIDIVRYDKDPATFIENALSPAKNLHVLVTDAKKQEAMVIADQDNFSLAIGKKGLNVKLASRLTKYKIDIKDHEQAKEYGISIRSE